MSNSWTIENYIEAFVFVQKERKCITNTKKIFQEYNEYKL